MGAATTTEINVELSLLDGEIYREKKGDGGYKIKYRGLLKLNRYARISIIKPPKIFYEGGYVGNPYKVVEDGFTRGGIARAIGIGRSPMGGIILSEQSIFYDTSLSLANDLLHAIRINPAIGFIATSKNDKPEQYKYWLKGEEITKEVEGTGWCYIPINQYMGGVYINIREQGVAYIMEKHNSVISGMSRYLQTLIDKQVLRSHPAIGIDSVENIRVETTKKGKDVIGIVTMDVWDDPVQLDKIEDIQTHINEEGTADGIIGVDEVFSNEEEVVAKNDDNKTETTEKEDLISIIRGNPEKYLHKISKPIYEMTKEELKKIIG